MNNKNILYIAKDFSTNPGLRTKQESNYSGKEFLHECLIPWLEKNKDNDIEINLDGIAEEATYTPSFLEEAFGGAVREGYGEQMKKLAIVYNDDDTENSIANEIRKNIKFAEDNKKN